MRKQKPLRTRSSTTMKRFLTPMTSTPVKKNSLKKRKRTRRKVSLQSHSIPEKTMLKALPQKLIRKKVKSPLVVEGSLPQPLKMTKKKMMAKISSTTVTTMNKESTSGELKVTTGISITMRTKKLMN